ncbi:MAG: hypothetical protein E7395_00585 [Ruminococcaceae bacterium]|nr:hypothetical protein [Oscillospiraceae bacterium]
MFGIVCLIIKIKDIKHSIARKNLYKSLNKGRCSVNSTEHLKRIFVLSPKEILKGEKIVGISGNELRKISSIKDGPTRLAAENNAELSFSIDITNGNVYKVLNFRENEEKYYYRIDFPELNRYLEMNESAYSKYKSINSSNWQNFCL